MEEFSLGRVELDYYLKIREQDNPEASAYTFFEMLIPFTESKLEIFAHYGEGDDESVDEYRRLTIDLKEQTEILKELMHQGLALEEQIETLVKIRDGLCYSYWLTHGMMPFKDELSAYKSAYDSAIKEEELLFRQIAAINNVRSKMVPTIEDAQSFTEQTNKYYKAKYELLDCMSKLPLHFFTRL